MTRFPSSSKMHCSTAACGGGQPASRPCRLCCAALCRHRSTLPLPFRTSCNAADVLTIENSRSGNEMIHALAQYGEQRSSSLRWRAAVHGMASCIALGRGWGAC